MDVNREKLANEIIENEGLLPGDKITYDRLVQISEKYGLTPYVLATNILGITRASYYGAKLPSANATSMVILKHKIPGMIEEAVALRDTIFLQENLEAGSKIDYSQLSEIARKYKIKEKILAIYVFEISYSSFTQIKNGEKKRAIILYKSLNRDIAMDKEVESIRNEIIKTEGLKIGDKINYEELYKISVKYGIPDERLAIEIFGISKGAYGHIKRDPKRKAIMLKGYFSNEENLKRAQREVVEGEGLKPLDQIDYEKLLEIANRNHINERILAMDILGITQNHYYNIKYKKGMKAVILNPGHREKTPEEIKEDDTKFANQISIAQRHEKIIERYRQGISIEEISKSLGICVATVYNHVRKLSQEEQDELKEERKKNCALRDALREFLEEQQKLFVATQGIDNENIERIAKAVRVFGYQKQDVNFLVRVYNKKEMFMEGVKLLDSYAKIWELSPKEKEGIVQIQNSLRRKEIEKRGLHKKKIPSTMIKPGPIDKLDSTQER